MQLVCTVYIDESLDGKGFELVIRCPDDNEYRDRILLEEGQEFTASDIYHACCFCGLV